MSYFQFILLIFSLVLNAQTEISTEFITKTPFKTGTIIGLDNQDHLFAINGTALIKYAKPKPINYSNIQLGNIGSANIFNPLKVHVFYKDFNTVVVLDNRLNAIYKVDFNTMRPHRNVTMVSTGNDNTLWLFNQDTQQLEVYDYKQQITRVKTLPIASEVLDLKSNYNACWVLTQEHLISYNYFGSMTSKIENNGFTAIAETNENIILQKDNKLYYLAENSNHIIPIQIPKLLIKAFFATNEILYIYDGEFLHQYLLKTT